MINEVSNQVIDGRVGVVNPDKTPIAVIGPAPQGPTNVPTIVYKIADLVTTFGASGKLARAAALLLFFARVPVIAVRTADTTAGSYGAVTTTAGGTSVATVDGVVLPDDTYEVIVKFVHSGTITVGVAGILYQYSLDGGRNFSPIFALGTATAITLPGGVKLNYAAGNIIAGRTDAVRTTGPKWNAAQLTTACTALQAFSKKWRKGVVLPSVLAADIAGIEASLTAMEAVGKHRYFVAGARIPNAGETEAAYRTALATEYGASSSKRLVIGGGAAELFSPIDGRKLLSSIDAAITVQLAKASLGQDIAWKELGTLQYATIKDEGSNPKHHDEYTDPGLDALRLATLRTYEGEESVVYAGAARLLSPDGSDFIHAQHREVMDQACETTNKVLENIGSKPVRVSKETGFIREDEAVTIEQAVNAALLRDIGSASSAFEFVLNRTDNLLSTFTLSGVTSIIPLAYPKKFSIKSGFYNPALQFVQIAA